MALVLASAAAMAAQDSPPKPDSMSSQQGMEGMKEGHAKVQGMHTMPATVSAVDTKTGVVDATAGGMALKVHFPPASVANLKAGDQITLHLAFSKP
ncbi:hypothetical protein [Dyella amyloliquefaciens]|uniref:hypothetical protein n=1 Tax=Dyella amyloliquefaciens TaxID=1770545 RepID=UPI001E5AEF66|nr:hypothetical protein [Dyella amyloliquefaciens]